MARRRGREGPAPADVLAFPGRKARAAEAGRWLPSGRSLAVGLVLIVLAGGLYLAARETSLFALRAIDVQGASPDVEARVKAALRPLVGSSLVTFDRSNAERLIFRVAQVAGATFDRDFPHTLRVTVRAERPVAVLRQARDAWLVSARGRVLRRLETRPYPALPRIWVGRTVDLSVNATVGDEAAQAVQVASAAAAAHLPEEVQSVKAGPEGLTVVLASGTEVRLGAPGDARLKLAVARRILPLAPDAAYVDVSVPARAVAGPNTQVEG